MTRIQLRRDTSAKWTEVNPVLASGEMGVETNTGRSKMGDGATAWKALAYQVSSPSILTTTSPGDGAEAGTYERTSTTAAPTLRDIVTTLDFAEAKHGDGTENDTTVFTKAKTAIKAVGAGTLIVTAHRLNGERATWNVGSGGSVEAACVELPSNITVSAYGAKFTPLSTGTRALFGSEPNQKPTNELTATNVRWFGGTFVGTGAEAVGQYLINGNRVQDWVIRDMRVTKWGTTNGTGVINFKDAQRARVETCTLLECCKTGGRNAINFQTSPFGSDLLPYTEISITGNIVTGGGAAPICLQLTELSEYVNTAPNRVIVAFNTTESTGWAAFVMEIGGNPVAAKGHISQCLISTNHFRYTGPNTESRGAMMIINDSTPLVESGTVFSELNLVSNICISTRHGICVQSSYAELDRNQVTAAGNGIYCESSAGGAINISHVHVSGGFVKMEDGSTSFAIRLKNVIDGSVDTDVSFATGTTGTAKGVVLEKCLRIDLTPKVSLSPNYGIWIKESGWIYVLSGTRIYNPSTNATQSAIRIEGELTGAVFIEGVHVRDDRGGGAKMKYGIDNEGTVGKVFSRGNTLLGWTSAYAHGTFTVDRDQIIDETGNLAGTYTWVEIEGLNAKFEEAAGYSSKIQYTVDNGIVTLRGAAKVKEEIVSTSEIFKIPVAGRPANSRLFTLASTTAVRPAKIASTGAVTILTGPLAVGQIIDLSGISFPLAG